MAPTFFRLKLQAQSHDDYINPKQKGFILHINLSLEEMKGLIIMLIGRSWDDLPPSLLQEKKQQIEPFGTQYLSKILLGEVLPVLRGLFQITRGLEVCSWDDSGSIIAAWYLCFPARCQSDKLCHFLGNPQARRETSNLCL